MGDPLGGSSPRGADRSDDDAPALPQDKLLVRIPTYTGRRQSRFLHKRKRTHTPSANLAS